MHERNRHLGTGRAALGCPVHPAQLLALGSPRGGQGCKGGWGRAGRPPGPCQPMGQARELLHLGACCLRPRSRIPQGVWHWESITNPKPVESDPHLHIKPFYISLAAYEGHKPSSKVIYLCFKAPLQRQSDLWGPRAHDQEALNI